MTPSEFVVACAGRNIRLYLGAHSGAVLVEPENALTPKLKTFLRRHESDLRGLISPISVNAVNAVNATEGAEIEEMPEIDEDSYLSEQIFVIGNEEATWHHPEELATRCHASVGDVHRLLHAQVLKGVWEQWQDKNRTVDVPRGPLMVSVPAVYFRVVPEFATSQSEAVNQILKSRVTAASEEG